MGFWDILKRRDDRWPAMHHALTQSFGRLKSETSLIFSWLHYFREKDRMHDERERYTQQGLERHAWQITQLREEVSNLKTELRSLKTAQGQVGTTEGTIKGQIRDMSQAQRQVQKEEKTTYFDKTRFRGTEIELLQLLYHSDRPLSYNEIAKRLSKSEKSIRNLIYELRKKGLDVKARALGVREKGFYLQEQTKIAISGR